MISFHLMGWGSDEELERYLKKIAAQPAWCRSRFGWSRSRFTLRIGRR